MQFEIFGFEFECFWESLALCLRYIIYAFYPEVVMFQPDLSSPSCNTTRRIPIAQLLKGWSTFPQVTWVFFGWRIWFYSTSYHILWAIYSDQNRRLVTPNGGVFRNRESDPQNALINQVKDLFHKLPRYSFPNLLSLYKGHVSKEVGRCTVYLWHYVNMCDGVETPIGSSW